MVNPFVCFPTKQIPADVRDDLDRAAAKIAAGNPALSPTEVARAAAASVAQGLTQRKLRMVDQAVKQLEIRANYERGATSDRKFASLLSVLFEDTTRLAPQVGPNIASAQKFHTKTMGGLMAEAMVELGPKFAGLGRKTDGVVDNIGRELMGVDTGDAAAKSLMKGFVAVTDYARNSYHARNIPVGHVASYIPYRHNPAAVVGDGSVAAQTKWVDATLSALDHTRMIDRDTGNPFADEDTLRGVLEHVWDKFKTGDGAETGFVGAPKSLADRLSHERFFVFKDFDTWKAYNDTFGNGEDLMTVWQKYIHQTARNLAVLDAMGADPSATYRMMDNLAKALDRSSGGASYQTRLSNAWALASGALTTPGNAKWAEGMEVVRTLTSAANLESATIPAVLTDPLFSAGARALTGRSIFSMAGDYARGLRAIAGDDIAMIRAGVTTDYFMAAWRGTDRAVGELEMSNVAHRISDVAQKVSLLTLHTEAIKAADGVSWRFALLDNARSKKWADLDPRFRDGTMAHYGITEDHWNALRGYVQSGQAVTQGARKGEEMLDVMGLAHKLDNDLGMRLFRMIETEGLTAVPQASGMTRSPLLQGTRAGTPGGEFIRQATQWFNWPMAVYQGQYLRRINDPTLSAASKARQLTAMGGGLLFTGYLSVQTMQVLKGQEPMPMFKPDGTLNTELLARAATVSGFLGPYTDVLFRDMRSNGPWGGLGDVTAGATVKQVGQSIYDLTLGAGWALAMGEEVRYGRVVANAFKDNIPLGSLWYTRALGQRLIYDTFLEWADPDANDVFRAKNRRAQDLGAPYLWRPGSGIEGLKDAFGG